MQAPTLPAGSPPARLHIARFLLQDRAFFCLKPIDKLDEPSTGKKQNSEGQKGEGEYPIADAIALIYGLPL